MEPLFAAADLGQSFVGLFTGFSIIALFLVLTGLMLVVIEIFRPSKWRFALLGGVMAAAGIVLRMLAADGTVGMLLIMLLFVAAVLFSFHILSLRLQKRQWLLQSVKMLFGDEESDAGYEFLVGLTGVSVTDINGEGSMVINDITFLAYSDCFIERGSKVRVTAVEGGRIAVVKEINEK